ncbi:hypothetical protein MES5069_620128 [Mesorhizobium escarrei]|uniref:Uncharacterized protein n=1 Tax=Mesorhizobium escarrei TaxID=666018 RepID=A0ABM9EEW8_9HYPH|nr:hypothetical protein MES5069_620128 [Mesorhizobium escarrei]
MANNHAITAGSGDFFSVSEMTLAAGEIKAQVPHQPAERPGSLLQGRFRRHKR